MLPVVLAFLPETTDVVQTIRRITAPLYKSLAETPFTYKDHTFTFSFRVEKADNPMLSKVLLITQYYSLLGKVTLLLLLFSS